MADVRGARIGPRGRQRPHETRFRLLGHDCPYGAYPAPLVPVGRLAGKLVAIYPAGQMGPSVEEIDDEFVYVPHSKKLCKSLAGFDYRVDRLFGLSRDQVLRYRADREAEYLRGLGGKTGER